MMLASSYATEEIKQYCSWTTTHAIVLLLLMRMERYKKKVKSMITWIDLFLLNERNARYRHGEKRGKESFTQHTFQIFT